MKDFCTPLETAIETEYMSLEEARVWADIAVAKFSRPRAWVAELACLRSIDEARDIISDGLVDHDQRFSFDRGRLLLGFEILRYREGSMDLKILEVRMEDLTDPDSIDGWTIECLVHLFNRDYSSQQELVDEIELNFGVYGDHAEKCYAYLLSDDCMNDHAAQLSHARAL